MYRQPLSQALGTESIRFGDGDDAPNTPPPPSTEDPDGDPTPRPWPTDPDKDDESTPRPWPTDPDKDDDSTPRPWPTDPDKDDESTPRPWPTDPDKDDESTPRPWPTDPDKDDDSTPRPWPTDPDKDDDTAARPWPTDPDKDDDTAARPWPTDPDKDTQPENRQFGGSQVSGKVFGLLIGIDKYDKPGADLKGCVRDSREVERYLRENVDRAKERLFLRCLRSMHPDDEATGQNGDATHPVAEETHLPAKREQIIAGFTRFLTQAGPDDTVFIHYSGHGSTEKRPEELWHLDPEENSDHKGETIICQDSYTPDNGTLIAPIRDQEIRWMISNIAKKDPHVVVIMDCCNSSGNTRDFDAEVTVRYTSPEQRAAQPGIESFVFYQQDDKARQLLKQKDKSFQIPQGRHLAMYACHSYELAKETGFPEGRFGAFTYYTLQTLRTTRGRVSYRDLIKLVRAKTAAKVSFQSPQYFSPVPEDVDQYFLGGSVAKEVANYTVTPGASGRGTLDAGTLHGILPIEDGTTQLMLYPPDADLKTAKPSEGLAATITAVTAQESIVELSDGKQFSEGVTYYKAIVTAAPMPATRVRIMTEIDEELVDPTADAELAAGVELLKAAVAKNPFVELVDGSADRQFTIFVYRYKGENKFRIAERDKTAAMVQPKTGLTAANANKLVDELAHISRWERTLHLENDHPAIIQPSDLSLIAIDADGNEIKKHSGEIVLHLKEGEPKPRLKFKVVANNTDQVPLYCDLIHLKSDFGIAPGLLPPDTHLGRISFQEGRRRTERDQLEVYAGAHVSVRGKTDPLGLYLTFSLPEDKNEDTDHFKLIASTEQFDPMHLWQASLERATSHRGETPKVKSPLDALMRTVATRSASFDTGEEAPAERVTDWWTTHITVRTVRKE